MIEKLDIDLSLQKALNSKDCFEVSENLSIEDIINFRKAINFYNSVIDYIDSLPSRKAQWDIEFQKISEKHLMTEGKVNMLKLMQKRTKLQDKLNLGDPISVIRRLLEEAEDG